MGMIVDRSNLKSGKMLPFIRLALIPIAIVTLLMYLSPNLDKTQLMIYSAIVYVAWGMIYTVGDVSFWGLPNVMTPDSEERSSVISVSKIFNSIGSAVPEVLFLVIGLIFSAWAGKQATASDPLMLQKRKEGKEFTFYHKVIDDVESYRQRLYGSIPLQPFDRELQVGDTLRFVIKTYDEGMKRREFYF